MMGVQINTELRTTFAVNVPLRTFLLEAPTIAKIARVIDELLAASDALSQGKVAVIE